MLESLENSGLTPRIWQVGALCRAVADALQARFNPVAVQGEISGFTRASSGHCYFTLKDEQGQLRCAMFKRAAQMLDFQPRDGDQVTLQGRLGVYEPRGELQLIVESLRRAGQGALFEQFLRIKAKLEAQGLFAPERKRAIPTRPRHIGVVTSLGAAALHDVATALQRRVPHIAVTIAPASVQGAQAPASLVQALELLARQPQIDVILLVRGGGRHGGFVGFQRRAAGARHRGFAHTDYLRRRARNRLHHCRFLCRFAGSNTHRSGRALRHPASPAAWAAG